MASTSSCTSLLAQFHFMFTGWEPVNTTMFSSAFDKQSRRFGRAAKKPAIVILRRREGGVWGMDGLPIRGPFKNQVIGST